MRKSNFMTPYLRLMRPANIITAWADILVGFVASGIYLPVSFSGFLHSASGFLPGLGWLLLATTGLYGGGVVMNDVFDLEIDRKERPERPLPSGKADVRGATVLGIALLLLGVMAAAQVNGRSALLAFVVAILAVVYDAFGKHHAWLGPINMGLCRGANLLLGLSILPLTQMGFFLALIPVLYISAITLVSRGEVGGSTRRPLYSALAGYFMVIAIIVGLAWFNQGPFFPVLVFLTVFGLMILPPLFGAIARPSGPNIGKAVRAGVLALIAMDAALAAAFGGWQPGILVLLLLPLSLLVARFFAVT